MDARHDRQKSSTSEGAGRLTGRSAADAEAHAQPHASEEVLIRRVIAHQLMTTAGLPITDAQGKRLCGLESGEWDRVLIDLVKRGVLVPSSDDTYVISRTGAGAAMTGPSAGRERPCHVPDAPGAR